MIFSFLLLLPIVFANVLNRNGLSYDDDRMKFSFGTLKESSYGQPAFLQIPTGPGRDKLTVPKAFYHYSDAEVGADSTWGMPDDSQLLASKTMLKNNRREINGMYLPLPNGMDPINVHLITQKTFEKGWDTSAYEDSPEGALARAKRVCLLGDEEVCETALLNYHRLKSAHLRLSRAPLHRQLLSLGDIAAQTKFRDRVGNGMGVVVGIPGYDPVYMGASMDNNNDGDYRIRFSPPR